MRGKTFLKWTRSIDLSSKLCYLHIGVILTIKKVFIILFLLCLWEQGPSWNFQNKSVNSPLNWVSRFILFLPKLKGKGLFWKGARRRTTVQDYHLVDTRDKKVSPFVEFEIILPLVCFLLVPLSNKHYRTWSSMIILWIDSRTCQK